MGRRGELLPIEHGSDYKNALRCRKWSPDGICTPCRLVHNAHHRDWRRNNAQAREAQRAYNLARTRAWAALARKYKTEYWALLDAELKRNQDEGRAA